MIGERKDVVAPLAERRNCDLDDVEPEVQILAERAARDRVAKIGIRRAEHAYVDTPRLTRSETLEFAALQHAQ